MAITFVQKSSQVFGDGVTSFSTSLTGVTAGNFVVVTVDKASGSDSNNPALAMPAPDEAAWLTAIAGTGPTGTGAYRPVNAIFYKLASAGGTETVTWSSLPGDSYIEATISEFHCDGTWAFDTAIRTIGDSSSPASVSGISNAVATALAIAVVATDANTISSLAGPTTGYTQIDISDNNSAHNCYGSGYKILSATGAQSAGWTWTGSGPWMGSLALFHEVAGGDITLTGQSATLAQGTLGVSKSLALTGQAIASAQGTVSPRLSAPLVGQSGSLAQGTLGLQKSLGLTGQSLAAAQGTIGIQLTLALDGQSMTLTQGSLAPAKSLGLTGQSLVFAQGNLTAGGDVAVGLSGAGIAVLTGTLTPGLSLALSGQPAVLSQGTLSARIAAVLTGQSLAFGTGTLTPVNDTPIGQPLIGQGMQLRQGFVTPVGGQGSGSSALRRWALQMYTRYFEEREAKRLIDEQAVQIEANIVDRRPVAPTKKAKATVLRPPVVPVPVTEAFPWLRQAPPPMPRIVVPDFKAQSAQIQSLLRQAAKPSPATSDDDEDEELLLMALI